MSQCRFLTILLIRFIVKDPRGVPDCEDLFHYLLRELGVALDLHTKKVRSDALVGSMDEGCNVGESGRGKGFEAREEGAK